MPDLDRLGERQEPQEQGQERLQRDGDLDQETPIEDVSQGAAKQAHEHGRRALEEKGETEKGGRPGDLVHLPGVGGVPHLHAGLAERSTEDEQAEIAVGQRGERRDPRGFRGPGGCGNGSWSSHALFQNSYFRANVPYNGLSVPA